MSGIISRAAGLKLHFLAAFLGGTLAFTSILGVIAYSTQPNTHNIMNGASGATDVVRAALALEQPLRGDYMNDYNPQDTGMQNALTYWHKHCSNGTICDDAMPLGWYHRDGTTITACKSGAASCASYAGLHDTEFVNTVYGLAQHPLSATFATAMDYWNGYKNNAVKGWQEIPMGTKSPLPGDIIMWQGGQSANTYPGKNGHLGIVVEMLPPGINSNGSVTIAQADGVSNLSSPTQTISTPGIHLLQAALLPNFTIPDFTANTLPGQSNVQMSVLGYIRNPSLVQTGLRGASARLVRIYQGNRDQYYSQAEYEQWWQVACSTTSMTEVLDAYGEHYKINDVVNVQYSVGGINGGLTGRDKIAETIRNMPDKNNPDNKYKTIWGGPTWYGTENQSQVQITLGQAIEIGNSGAPLIVGVPPDKPNTPFTGAGHLLVILGGDDQNVYLADSSGADFKTLGRDLFNRWWDTMYAVVVPTIQPEMPPHMPNSPWVQVAYNDATYYQSQVSNPNFPSYFVKQIDAESGFKIDALGPTVYPDGPGKPTNAVGIAQFLPSTAAGVKGLDPSDPGKALDPNDPGPSLEAAAKTMVDYYNQYLPGSSSETDAYMKALAAYNTGPGNLQNAIQRAAQASQQPGGEANWFTYVSSETQKYINKIMDPATN